jgi:hypothetical protein
MTAAAAAAVPDQGAGTAPGADGLAEELAAVIAAAAAVALSAGVRRPAVAAVRRLPGSEPPGPWVLAGRLSQMGARRDVQRRMHSSR